MTKTNLIRALGLYAILGAGAFLTLEHVNLRLFTLILIAGAALKTLAAWGREQ